HREIGISRNAGVSRCVGELAASIVVIENRTRISQYEQVRQSIVVIVTRYDAGYCHTRKRRRETRLRGDVAELAAVVSVELSAVEEIKIAIQIEVDKAGTVPEAGCEILLSLIVPIRAFYLPAQRGLARTAVRSGG